MKFFIFRILDLNTCTALSASPLVTGSRGADRMCFILFAVQKSALVNAVPLSDTRLTGRPLVAKILLSAQIVVTVYVLGTMSTPNHLACASMTSMNNFVMK